MRQYYARLKWKLYLVVARYFQFFANFSFRRWKPRVIAVTGSVGKTTLLNLLEVQLGERAHYTHDANSIYGLAFDMVGLDGVRGSKLRWFYLFLAVPLRSLWFKRSHEFYVVEIDGERPKETEILAKWFQPEVTLWVSLGRSHAAHFDNQVTSGEFADVDAAILHEFMFLPRFTSQQVFYNADEPAIQQAMSQIDVASTGVSSAELESYEVWPKKTVFRLDGQSFEFQEPMPGEVYVQLGLLKALANYLDEPVTQNLETYRQPPGRSSFLAGIKDTKLIDSSYNAHLISMKSIIDMFSDMKTAPKWAVIGDMIEQGQSETVEHQKLGEVLAEAGFERYILVGRRTQQHTYPELKSQNTVTFLQPKHALRYLQQEISGGETILFKGSQYLEGIIEQLLASPSDVAKLARQEPAAKKRRARWGL